MNQEEIENLNRPITNMEIETVIRNLPKNYRRKLPSSFYKVTITLIPKPDNDITHTQKKRKLHTSIIDEHRSKNPQQNNSNQNLTIH